MSPMFWPYVVWLRDRTTVGSDIGLGGGSDRAEANGVEIQNLSLAAWLSDEAIRNLKFSDCLPPELARRVVEDRLRDDESVHAAIVEPRSNAS